MNKEVQQSITTFLNYKIRQIVKPNRSFISNPRYKNMAAKYRKLSAVKSPNVMHSPPKLSDSQDSVERSLTALNTTTRVI